MLAKVEGDFALIGFACDEGVKRNHGRPGAAFGPTALRQAFAKLPIHQTPPPRIVDLGDVDCIDGNLEASQERLAELVFSAAYADIPVAVLGGGHELALGTYRGLAKAGKNDLAIVNIDAHFDLRPPLPGGKGSSGTPFRQIALEAPLFDYTCIGIQQSGNAQNLFSAADKLGAAFVTAEEIAIDGIGRAMQLVEKALERRRFFQLSLCLDAFSEALAPGVSAPQALGLFPWQVLPLIRILAKHPKLAAVEIAELSPPLDRANMTARLAANFLHKFI